LRHRFFHYVIVIEILKILPAKKALFVAALLTRENVPGKLDKDICHCCKRGPAGMGLKVKTQASITRLIQ
jgi:hypothetical protein